MKQTCLTAKDKLLCVRQPFREFNRGGLPWVLVSACSYFIIIVATQKITCFVVSCFNLCSFMPVEKNSCLLKVYCVFRNEALTRCAPYSERSLCGPPFRKLLRALFGACLLEEITFSCQSISIYPFILARPLVVAVQNYGMKLSSCDR